MKLRIVGIALGVVALLGVGVGPASAETSRPCLPTVIYPWCG